MITAATQSGNDHIVSTLQPIYSDLTRLMERASPQWATANRRWGNMRLDEVAQELGDAMSRTLETYRDAINLRLLPKFGSMALTELIHQAITAAHASWRAHRTAANNALATLSSILGWAEDQSILPRNSNPCPDIKRYKTSKKERFLSSAELRRVGDVLLAWQASDSINPYAAYAIRLLVVTGARLNEIVTLRWENVMWEQRCLQLPDSKTGFKYIILSNQALAILREVPREGDNPYVIVGRNAAAHFVGLKKVWRALRTAAEVPDLRLHDLRHSFASFAVNEAGASLPVVGKLLGHANAQTTDRYSHIAADPARAVAEATGQHIADVWGVTRRLQRVGGGFRKRYTVAERVALARRHSKAAPLDSSPA